MKMLKRICKECNKEFSFPKSRDTRAKKEGRSPRAFCNRDCFRLYSRASAERKKPTKIKDELTPKSSWVEKSKTIGKCLYCNGSTKKKSRRIRGGKENINVFYTKYCCHDHAVKHHTKLKHAFYENNKRECKCGCGEKFRIDGLKRNNKFINFKHYMSWKMNRPGAKACTTTYRSRAFYSYGKECELCGFDAVVDVHHIDSNRLNNKVENLCVLCPNHHRMVETGLITLLRREDLKDIKDNINQMSVQNIIGNEASYLHR